MIKVVLWESWYDSAEVSFNRFRNQTPNGDGVWQDMVGTIDVADADYYIVFQKDSKKSELFPENRKIFIQREPEVAIPKKEFEKNRGICNASYENSYHFTTWWLDKTYSELKTMPFPEKTKTLNTILSYKRKTYGHRLRHAVVRRFLDRYSKHIDVYGSFHLPDTHEDVIHYRYPPLDKFKSSVAYNYQLVAENSQEKNYFSEKVIDAYLCFNVPIYWGCPNLSDYFPEESFHDIDLESPHVVEEIRELSSTPPSKITIDAVRYARELILDSYNIWPALYHLIRSLPPTLRIERDR